MARPAIYSTILLIMLFLAPQSYGQVRQKGIVLIQNSNKQPLSQVSILVSGAVPTVSDSYGLFDLHFATRKEGDAVRTINIEKSGFELVNAKDVELWNISATDTFIIVMCPKGKLAESRRKYYKLGEDRYYQLYHEKLSELNRAMEEHKLQEAEYNTRLDEANMQLQRAMERLDEFCDKFARINRDMLNDLDRLALERLDEGDIDGAIQVYEEAQLLETFNKKRLLRDSVNMRKIHVANKIKEEIQLLEKDSTEQSSARRDSLQQILRKHN